MMKKKESAKMRNPKRSPLKSITVLYAIGIRHMQRINMKM
jgi:hypothetical protein